MKRLIISVVITVVAGEIARAGDWPQWCGTSGKSMVSPERGLPESFEPGKKTREGVIDLVTATNVRWGIKVADALYSTPSVAGGKVFVGGLESQEGVFACLDAAGRQGPPAAGPFPKAVDRGLQEWRQDGLRLRIQRQHDRADAAGFGGLPRRQKDPLRRRQGLRDGLP